MRGLVRISINERSYLFSAKRHVDSSENRQSVRYNLTITLQLTNSSVHTRRIFNHRGLMKAEVAKINVVCLRVVNSE